MTEYTKIALHRAIENDGSVEVDVVPHDGGVPTTRTFDNYDEALAEITGLWYENEVYF